MINFKKIPGKTYPFCRFEMNLWKKLAYRHITIIKNKPRQITRFKAQDKYIESLGHPQIKTYIDFARNQNVPLKKFKLRNQLNHTTAEQQQKMYRAQSLGKQNLMVFQQFKRPYIRKDDYQVLQDVDVSKMTFFGFLKHSFYFEGDQKATYTPDKTLKQIRKTPAKLSNKDGILAKSNQTSEKPQRMSLYTRIQVFISKIKFLRISKQHDFFYSVLIMITALIGSYFYFVRGRQYELVKMNHTINTQVLDKYYINVAQKNVLMLQKRIGIVQAEFYKRLEEAKIKN